MPSLIVIIGSGYTSNALKHYFLKSGRRVLVLPFRLRASEIKKQLAKTSGIQLDVIICGCITRHIGNDQKTLNKNLIHLIDYIEALRVYKLKSCTYLSSVDVYGKKMQPGYLTESTAIQLVDFYSTAKYCTEEILSAFCSEYDVPLFRARCCGIFGPQDNGRSAISQMIISACRNRRINLDFKCEVLRDYIFIDDLTRIIGIFISEPRAIPPVNVATGSPVELNTLAKKICDLTSATLQIEEKKDALPLRSMYQVFDISRLKLYFPDFEFTDRNAAIRLCIESYVRAEVDG
jgi:nucleoside-diphosphate-sugar epimerase